MERGSSEDSYINELAKYMEASNVYLAVTYLADLGDLVEVSNVVKDPEWRKQAEGTGAPIVGTLMILTGTYGLNSRHTSNINPFVRKAVSEIKETLNNQSAGQKEKPFSRIIYGMDGLGLSNA